MDPVGIIGSCAGIIALGITLSEKLSQHIDDTTEAPQKLTQLVTELRATAHSIQDLHQTLTEDQALEQPIISKNGQADCCSVFLQCDSVFRKVVTLIAKAGRSALEAVDELQRGVNNSARNGKTSFGTRKLDFELSTLDQLTWPWHLRKIERRTRELELLKKTLTFKLNIAIFSALVRSKPALQQSDVVT